MNPTHPVRFLLLLLAARPAGAAEPGSIIGTVVEPKRVTAVLAIDRATDKKFPGAIDAATGQFTIQGLPAGARYDCLIDFDGARLEGVDLKVPPSDYEEEQPLSAEDVATIKSTVKDLNQFEDVLDVLEVRGNIEHAAVLVNKVRAKPFYGSKPGEVVWRAELWHFERPDETWVKVQDELFLVYYRERLSKENYARKSLTFDPALGGLEITPARPRIDLGPIRPPSAGPGVRFRAETHGGDQS